MRAGGCTVQQALTPEATAVVKQAVSLARRRGNPQVTPLHVASAMLQHQQHGSSSSMGLLRAACLRSHSHPLQCKALELCFNVRALACHDGDGVWLVGHGTYQSYVRCRAGRPSLEMLWELQTLAVPAGSLALSLNLNAGAHDSATVVNRHPITAKCEDRSRNDASSRCLSLLQAGSSGHLTTCAECSAATKCEAKPSLLRSVVPSSSSIPHWLHQHCRDQELSHSKKWGSMCGGSPSQRTTLNLSTVLSPPSSSVSSYEKQHYHRLHQSYHQPWLLADVHEASGGQVHVVDDNEDVKLVKTIKVKSHDSGASNGSSEEDVQCRRSRFKELTAENLKALCSALEKEVPWQAAMAPEIASTVLRCRSGMASRRRRDAEASRKPKKEDTWLLFLGGDADGKARVARELARLVFGSRNRFVSIGAAASCSPAARSDSTYQQQQEGNGIKRPRSSSPAVSCVERLYEAVRADPRRVIVVEDVERAGRPCQLGIVEAIESGVVRSHGRGDDAALGDAIVVLSCESFDARSRASSPPVTTKKAKLETKEDEEEGTGDPLHDKEAATSASASSFDLNTSVENDDVEDGCGVADAAGLLKAVDRAFFFRLRDETSD
ncbi:hypothetical protein PR202_ga01616 [Eleusine coracana subsp. coracana]|uniref:SMAX1-like nucleotide binding domain-containing protein n=1 Tax=Eleusine coracana subsp. coracana TaxID=191504 RepID=A0AAV5BHR1_ELECO|nr:hypothetical protein PR202_ga00929 [Eleusine coracana subsp. coracana]GJM85816.1 hypothetical protein PR202_ga01616 [Eleusine coracana subsp. coracana]